MKVAVAFGLLLLVSMIAAKSLVQKDKETGKILSLCVKCLSLSFEWNSIRLGGPAHEKGTKTVHKTLLGGGGEGSRGW